MASTIEICGIAPNTDEAVVDGIFPHGQTGTRGAPGVHDLRIGTRAGRDVLNEVEHEGLVLDNGANSHMLECYRVACPAGTSVLLVI